MAGTNFSTPARRELFTAFGATGLAALALCGFAKPEKLSVHGAPPTDSHLLDLVAQLIETEDRYAATNEPWAHTLAPAPQYIVDELSALNEEAEALRLEIAALPAQGAMGRAAKARVALEQVTAFAGGLDLDANESLIVSLCHDVLSAGAAA